jgi:alpha-mannosidase
MDPRIIRRKLDILNGLTVVESQPLGGWQARTARYLSPDRYEILTDWHGVAETTNWPALQTVFLKTPLRLPPGWERARTVLSFSFRDLEGLLRVGGEPWAGLDFAHRRVAVPPAADGALLEIEFYSVPQASWEPGLRSREGAFEGGRLELLDLDLEQACYDLRFAVETMNVTPDERRKALLSAAIEDALLLIDLTASAAEVRESVTAARRLLAERVAAIGRDPEGGRLLLTGHTHIDTAWLWPLKETVRKCGRTFATACRLMERYPDYHFACSQAQLYAYTKQYYPGLYEEIRRWVASGRWETTGGMWVEADANVISGESMVRQILYGLAFFREEFGTRPTLCWLPDVFGYNGNMPQILAACGLRSFWTWKLHWQSRNPFPYHLFWWEGIDGTRVMAHIPKLGGGAYNGTPNPEQLARSWETYAQKGGYPEQLFPFGYGDGGGGVTAEMMEFANRAADYPGLPRCRQGTPEQFFAAVRAASPELPVWVGELYLETHRGTYTTQGRTKRGNRLCEVALRDLEVWGTLARALDTAEPPASLPEFARTLRSQWSTVLLHQFHDILPGSSIGEVYVDTAADHARVLSEAGALREAALRRLGGGGAPGGQRFRVFNSLSWARSGVVRLAVPGLSGPLSVTVGDSRVPAQVVARTDGACEVLALVPVPALGATTLEVCHGAASGPALSASGRTMENEFLRVEVGEDGSLLRLFDKRLGREVIAAGERGNRLQLFQDGPEREAAWNIHATYARREYSWDGPCQAELVENGPVRAMVRVTRSHRATRLVQEIILWAGVPRLDFRTRVDWREKQTLLKAAFPVAVHAPHATFEIQYGALERATHRNTSWEQEKFEVCGLRWADLSEGGYGVSLLNDSHYGHDVLGNVLRLTLLRGTEYPDPDADQGEHEFTYALLPHEGDWRQGGTVRRAAELNVPLTAVPTAAGAAAAVSYLTIEGPALLEALKPAEDGNGVILRLYEPHGARGRVTVAHRLPFSEVQRCNLVEEGAEPVAATAGAFAFDIEPFRVCSFRLCGPASNG